MRTIVLLFAAAVAWAAPSLADAQRATSNESRYSMIRCESFGTRQSFCAADTRGGIRLANDHSGGRCQIGRTWGYNAQGVWVAGGCRADFSLGRGENYGWGSGFADASHVVCSSDDFQRRFCPADTTRGVRLVNQISNSACVRGRTWWRDARGIVVTNGCAGEFQLGYRDAGYTTPAATGAGGVYRPERFVCSAQGGPRRYCPADVGSGAVALVKRIGSAPCVYGKNWSYDRQGVWVSQGCVAEFEVGYTDQEWVPEPQVRYVRCESMEYERTVCDTDGATAVTLQRQLSNARCIEGRTWGVERNRVWVDDGCAADFLLN